ncbi:transcription factor SRM1 isoform X1 [Curcuma longa]
MVMEVESCGSSWTREQEKAFENALATHPEDCSDRWEKIAADVPGKTVEDVKDHYELLVEDVNSIESGRVPLPSYPSSSDGGDHATDTGSGGKKGGNGDGSHSGKASRAEQERRKGIAWTEDEHRLFLLGLDKYGKGDWRSISRNFVISRTPTQVASHAQKYFIRLNSMNKERRRTSIHDITSVGDGDVSAPQGPITGQVSGSVTSTTKPIKQSSHPAGVPPAVNMFGATIGQPVAGSLIPAVGTPVSLPVPGAPHIAYGVRAPVSGSTMPGGPVNMPPMTNPMSPTSANR